MVAKYIKCEERRYVVRSIGTIMEENILRKQNNKRIKTSNNRENADNEPILDSV